MILILDDHPLAREGLSSLIQMCRSDEEILHASTVIEAIGVTQKNDINMVFIDLNLGNESGFDYLVWLKEQDKSHIKTFIITSSNRHSDLVFATEMDVDAYVLKDTFIDEIIYGLKIVERGGKFYSANLIARLHKNSEDERALKELTQREMEVFALLSQGYSNMKISETLYISEGTTKKHISSVLNKLNLQNRVQAIMYARNNRYILKKAMDLSLKDDLRRKECSS